MLDYHSFLNVVDSTPLVSVDLLIVRGGREVLLGLRNNRPAQGSWFAPGGRILKNETIQSALIRIADKELGFNGEIAGAELTPTFHGVYEHMYEDCFAGDIGVSTHYVVLAYKIDVPSDFELPIADEQHAELKWWSIQSALEADSVHQYTKNYFLGLKS